LNLEELTAILSVDVVSVERCVEMNFGVKGFSRYEDCWLGKMKNKRDGSELYWFGLVEGGSQAYDYATLAELLGAKVFEGKSLTELLPLINWYTLDGCELPQSILPE